MNPLLTFLKNKMVTGGIFMVFFYQVIFIGLFMYGYSAIPKNMTELSVAIVNEDANYGKQIAEQLQGQLPFKIDSSMTLEEAQKRLNDRDVQMVVHIPQDFSEKLANPDGKVQIDFLLNGSNPAMVSSSMQSVVTQITNKLNANLAVQSAEGVLKGAGIADDQAKQMAQVIPSKLNANIVTDNAPPAGMHNQMAPMFLSMVSYVGAMIFSMILTGATNGLRKQLGNARAFMGYQGVSILTSIVAPLVGLGIYFSIQGGYGAEKFFHMWMLHSLEMFTAIQFTGIFCLLAGQAGMLLNLPIMLIQTIASGAVMTQDMMPGLFKAFSYIVPMFYSVHADFDILFGGGKLGTYVIGLAAVGLFSLLIGILIYQLKCIRADSAAKVKESAAA